MTYHFNVVRPLRRHRTRRRGIAKAEFLVGLHATARALNSVQRFAFSGIFQMRAGSPIARRPKVAYDAWHRVRFECTVLGR
jgi:hypothetical protein